MKASVNDSVFDNIFVQIIVSFSMFIRLNAHSRFPLRDATEHQAFLRSQARFATACALALQGFGLVPFATNLLLEEKFSCFDGGTPKES